ncbi:MAG: hypothetical protein OFPII_42820 [Osedax symbiont Rs1]|nr:MAG: hypothetical protein OFPII_42820 [Osedax symbiont Rs1]
MKIVVISLKDSKERRVSVEKMFSDIDIAFSFFDAINISSQQANSQVNYDYKKTLKTKGYKLTNPEIGCFESHRKVWQLCVKLNEPILVFEDNFEVCCRLDPYIQFALNNIDFLGVIKFSSIFTSVKFTELIAINTKTKLVKYNKKSSGTSCYMISPKVAEHFLCMSKKYYLPVDDFMEMEFYTKTPLFSFYPNVINRSSTKSTIGQRKVKQRARFQDKIFIEYNRIYCQLLKKVFNIAFRYKKLEVINNVKI